MDAATTKRTLKYLPFREAILIEGDHGLGKSEVVAQAVAELSAELKKPFQLIDFRLAQCEVGDLIGMMRHVDTAQVTRVTYINGKRQDSTYEVKNVTIHDSAEWFPTDPDSYGFLFLDELFRAPRDLQNAVLQLALDYTYNFKTLPKGWRVVSAANNDLNKYQGTIPDPALYSRFQKILFKPTLEEWVAHADTHDVHRAVVKYVSKFPADLDVPEKFEPGTIVPDRRSWTKLGQNMSHMAENGQDPLQDLDYLFLLAKGRVGSTVTANFVDYCRKNYKVYSPADILDKLTNDMLEEFKTMEASEITYYNKELVKFVKADGAKLTKKRGENLARYYKAVPKETATAFWMEFSSPDAGCSEIATAWYKDTPGIAEYTWDMVNKGNRLADKKKK